MKNCLLKILNVDVVVWTESPQWFCLCLTGSDASTGVMKPPKLNLAPKPPVRKCVSETDHSEEETELDLNPSDTGSPGSPGSPC